MPERRCFNAYIDESGDEGFRKLGERAKGASDASSEWLVLAAVLMFEEQDRERTQAVDRLRELLNRASTRAPLHWRDLRNDHSKKRRVMDLLAGEPLIFSVVALWKPGLKGQSAALKRKGYLYNYAARFLIERLSWFADRGGRRLNLFFESRATTSYADLEGYITAIQADPECSITPGAIARVQPVNASRKGAQLADFYASLTAEALEPDPYGYTTPDYLLRVRHQLFRRPPRSVLRDGFKIFPDRAADAARYSWLRRL